MEEGSVDKEPQINTTAELERIAREYPGGKNRFNSLMNKLADESRVIQAGARERRFVPLRRTGKPGVSDIPKILEKSATSVQFGLADETWGAIAGVFELAARASGGRKTTTSART